MKPNIQEMIQTAMHERAAKLDITAKKVLEEIAKLVFLDPRRFSDDDMRLKPVSDLDANTAAFIAGIETLHKIVGDEKDSMAVVTKIKFADKGATWSVLGVT
jgi:phage terminase small subunit